MSEGLKYAQTHEWVKFEGNEATVGLSEHALELLGDVVYIELPKPGDELKALDAIGVVESVKAASDIYTPISGKVVAINEVLMDKPQSINAESWLYRLKASDLSEQEKLLTKEQYQKLIG